MPKRISTQAIGQVKDAVTVDALDQPGEGGAHHEYRISVGNTTVFLPFQKGPIQVVGINGITNEALLAIVIDRLEGFQEGKYASMENHLALLGCRAALDTLNYRTQQRTTRGVEGTHAV